MVDSMEDAEGAVEKTSLEILEEKVYGAWKRDPMFWGKFFFAHHFRMESPGFHREILGAALKWRFLSVAAPRESAKSTILIFLYPFHGIIFKRFHFIVLVSNTFKKSAMHLDTIKKELMDNKLLIETFPGISITRDAEGDSEFRHSDGFSTKFLCKGVDQIGSIRGVKFGAYRPDLILCDDLEDDELVKNPIRRRDLQAEYDEALIPAGDKKIVQIINVGTILHDDSQMAKLVSKDLYPDFYKIVYRAHKWPDTPKEASLWPEKWSVDDLKKMKLEKPNVYAKEMQNNPVAGINVRFTREMFKYWRMEGSNYVLFDSERNILSRDSLKTCKAAIACDLAWDEDKDADRCVIMPGILTADSNILIMPYLARKGVRPTHIIEFLFSTVERLENLTGSSVYVGFEKAMLEKVTRWILRQEMKKRNKFLICKELSWEGDKIERIEVRLEPRYTNGTIYHGENMGDLEHELERFPSGSTDDIIDALQGLVQILQNPKTAEKPSFEQNQFSWWREQAINMRTQSKHKPKLNYPNKPQRFLRIPSTISWR